MDPIIVVRRMRRTLKPSTPRKYSAPIEGIQGARSTSWNAGSSGLYIHQSGTDTRKPARATMFAIQRIAFTFSRGTSSNARAPASGRKRMSERRWVIKSVARAFRRALRRASPQKQIHAHERENPEQHQERVILHEAGLQAPEPEAALFASPADEIHETVDDRAIGQSRQPRAHNRDPARPVDRAIDDGAIERPQSAAARKRS